MADKFINRSTFCTQSGILSIFLFLILFNPARDVQAQTGFKYSKPGRPFTTLWDLAPREYSFTYPDSLRITAFPRSFQAKSLFDSTMNLVTLKRMFKQRPVQYRRFYLFDDFLMERSILAGNYQWQSFLARDVTALSNRRKNRRGLVFRTGKIKSDAFRKAFGGDDISLAIDGRITINGTYKNEKRSGMKIASDRRPNDNFQMKMKQNFTVTGKIGEKITVDVAQDSENEFEFMNAVKLQYKNDEDGIVKQIDAGNVNLSLPGTNFVTMSQSNSGLFGLKADMQIGPLSLTAIASMEKGKKNTLSISGEGKTQTIVIEDYEYKRATYFFLDELYRNEFTNYNENGAHLIDRDNIITDIQIFKSDFQYESKPGAFQAWATLDPTAGVPQNSGNEAMQRYFLRLEPIKDYYVNRELGYIQMNMSLRESEILAVAYRDSADHIFGDLLAGQEGQTGVPLLKLIKAQSPLPTFKTWNLEWKNVYSIGINNITDKEFAENFKVKIFYKDPSGQSKESAIVNGQPENFIHIFGLDDIDINGQKRPDNIIDNNPNIINKARGEIIFPNLRPFDPQGKTGPQSDLWKESNSDKYRFDAVYDTTKRNYITNTSKFKIEIESKRKSPKYELGFNVIEGTEEIVCNGSALVKDVDYTIDYFSGTLVLTSDKATAPGANIDINYESQQMFSPDKKVLFGTRAEYSLWEMDNQRSFIGATMLYMSRTTLDRRIRLGKESPMSNLVWDVNTSLYYGSDKVTRFLNKLPILDLTGSSSVKFEAEVAQISPDPNTLNNEKTGDHNGVAYLDDFEGAKRKIALGTNRKQWHPASVPSGSMSLDSTNYYLSRKGSMVWYNPYVDERIQNIWPDKEVTSNLGGQTGVKILKFDFIPDTTISDPRTSWGGIQKGLNVGYYDQTDSRFLEIWIRPELIKGNYPTIYVDLGQVSEDLIPNGRWDTEDNKPDGGIRDTNLDPDKEDTGLDGMFGEDPPRLFYPHDGNARVTFETIGGVVVRRATLYDFWDIDGDNIKDPNEPWSYDDYNYTDKNPFKLRYDIDGENTNGNINGYENSKSDGRIRYPDSEDLNGNSAIDLRNNFFRFSFSLDPDSPDARYLVTETEFEGKKTGWKQYRIPLVSPVAKIENADWARVENARIWVKGVDSRVRFSIAEIQLVSNEWKFHGKKAASDSIYTYVNTDTTLSIAVINTHENPDYEPPKGVEGVIDPTYKIRSKEQSLVLHINDLAPDEGVIAKRRFYEPQNMIQYSTLKMFLHGGDVTSYMPENIEYFLRFGSDTQDKIYYEITLPEVKSGWQDNDIEIDFSDLSKIKLEKEILAQDTITRTLGKYKIHIKGNPSLRNIRWLIAGIKNKGNQTWTGEIWMDELRLSNVHKEKGMAMRAKIDFKLADLFSVNAQYDKKDAAFHTINERSNGEGSTTEGYNANVTLALHKLIPANWGLSIPISGRISKSTSTPKYMPGSDILLTKDTAPDSILKDVQTVRESKNIGFRFSKPRKSRSLLGRLLIDPISGGVNYSSTNSRNPRTGKSNGENYKGSFQYNLTFTKDNYLKPFKWLGVKGFLKKLAGTKIFLPSRLNFKMDGSDVSQQSESAGGVISDMDKAAFSKAFSINWTPLTPISMDYSLTNNYDLNADSTAEWKDVMGKMSEGSLIQKNQRISTSFNPKLFSWMTANIKYSTDYGYNFNPQMASTGSGKSAKVTTSLTFTSKLDPKKLVATFKKKRSSKSTSNKRKRPVSSRRRKPKKAILEEGETQKEDKTIEKKKKVLIFSKILGGVGKGISTINPISVSLRSSNNISSFGILSMPVFNYQLGFQDNPGVKISPNLTSDRSRSQSTMNLTLRSGFKFTRQLSVTLDYKMTDRKTVSSQSSRNMSKSVLVLGDKNSIPMPNWTLRWNGLEKFFFFKKIFTSLSLNHSYTGQMDEVFNGGSKTQVKVAKNFRPLIGVNLNMKNGITSNFKYGISETLTKQTQLGSSAKQIGFDLTFGMTYKKKGGLKIPFLKGKKLDNNMDFSLTFTRSRQANLQKTSGGKKFQIITETRNWSLKPAMTYSFSKNLRGGIHFSIGKRVNSRTGTTLFKEFGINASISLSG